MGRSAKERCEWLVLQNQYILLRDKDWDKILGDIMDNPKSFERYYPLVRVQVTSDAVRHVVQALALNDDLYQYVQSSI